ncbi:ATPase [Opitutaceae bacterium EW11]|nr:ATPase [Opitutaceae bacterium EW11]
MKPKNDSHGEFTAPGEIRLVRLLPGPIERVWEYLTDPEKRSRWFAGGPMELRAGGRMQLKFRHANIAPNETPPPEYAHVQDPGSTMDGRVLRCEPPRLLSYTFSEDSDVTFELSNEGDQVLLVLTHRSRGADLPDIHEYGSGWHTHLAILIALLEGTTPPAFWGTHSRLKAEYEKLRPAAASHT